jgi:CubicO group peptidase (beta-lactamase class C family)
MQKKDIATASERATPVALQQRITMHVPQSRHKTVLGVVLSDGWGEEQMRAAAIRLVAIIGTLSLLPLAVVSASGSEATTDCGSPSDIHDGWAIGSPEQQGIDPALLCTMAKGVTDGKLANVDSIVVVRHGVLVYERYFAYPDRPDFDAATRHAGNSMTKSVVSLLVGIAMDRGLIRDLDAPVSSYFPQDADLRRPEKDRITLRHLLTMSAGLYSARAPGTSFEYDDSETELVGAVLQQVSGKAVDVLAQENIFAPLGIDDVAWHGRLHNGPAKSSTGLSLRPRDWAKIGQLVLNRGSWEGKQIVPASWVAESTAEQIKTQGPSSYGYQWWLGRSRNNDHIVEWAAAMGFGSQKTIVIPELDEVVVFNASLQSKNMVAPEIELLDNFILPATLKH